MNKKKEDMLSMLEERVNLENMIQEIYEYEDLIKPSIAPEWGGEFISFRIRILFLPSIDIGEKIIKLNKAILNSSQLCIFSIKHRDEEFLANINFINIEPPDDDPFISMAEFKF